MLGPSGRDRPTLVSILYISILLTQNNPPTCSSLFSLFYKSLFLLPISESKKPILEIEKNNNIDSDVEM